ncbi:17092_t:CDS:2, partial [Racocetra persica]
MSSEVNSAVAKFNSLAASKSFWIPCGLHAIHIALTHFENTAFGKLDSVKRLSLKKHSYNLLSLAFYLHDGYNISDKDSLLNLKSGMLKELYKIVFNFEIREVHIRFAHFFIEQLENAKDVPKSYLN